jgi:hypothetical protein
VLGVVTKRTKDGLCSRVRNDKWIWPHVKYTYAREDDLCWIKDPSLNAHFCQLIY